jgi:hypothetical protein
VLDDCQPRCVELVRWRGRAATGDSIGLLDERNRHARGIRSACRGDEVARSDTAARSVAEHERAARPVDRLQVRAGGAVRCRDLDDDRSL